MYAYTYVSSIWSLNSNISTISKFNDTFSRFHNPLLQWPVSIETYIRLTLLPIWLSFYHVEDTFITPLAWARAWVVFLAFLAALIYSFRKNKFVFFWLSFFALVVSPNEIPYSLAYVVAERYMYGASVGILAAVVYVLHKCFHTAKAKKYLYIGLSIVLVLFMARTIARNTIWQDPEHLWLATVQDSPTSYAAHNNAGNVYAHSGRCVEGLREYKLKMKYIPPNFGKSEYGNGYYNMGVCATQLGQIDQAIEYYQKSAKLIPRMWLPFENLGFLYYKQKDYKRAREQFQMAVDRGSRNVNVPILLEQLIQKGF
jgi:tetratricopeptide (TPR) repeat protein